MAKLRKVTADLLLRPIEDVSRYDIKIEQGTQYEVAEKLMAEDYTIIFCNYWDDEDEKKGGQMTYSIDRKDIADRKRDF